MSLKSTSRNLWFCVLFILLMSCKATTPTVESTNQALPMDKQLDNLTNQMIRSLAEENKTQIAIMEFPDLDGNISELGKFIPEELTTRMFKTQKFEVIERQLLNKIMDEQKLGMTGIIDASSAAQVGKMLGVDAVVTGTITDMGDQIRLNARMISTETAGIFAVASVSIEKESYIVNMLNKYNGATRHQTEMDTLPDDEPPLNQPYVEENQNPAPNPSTAPDRWGDTPLTKVVVDGFLFEVLDAKLTNSRKLIIDLRVTNKGMQDREVGIYKSTEVYDNQGRKYTDPVRTIANKTNVHGSNHAHLFISELPINVQFEFQEVAPDIESVSLLKIKLWRIEGDVNLRNFPVRKVE